MIHNFDEMIDRKDTGAVKWDGNRTFCGVDDVIPMWVADMDFKSPQPVIQALRERVEHGVYGYTSAGRTLKSVIRDWFARRHGWDVDERAIFTLPTVIYSLTLAINAFSDIGDQVVIQTPVYHPFARIIKDNHRKIIRNSLVYNQGRYEMDFADLEEQLRHPKTKMLLLCSPHNPVGRVWTRDELTKVRELCAKYDVLILSDEIHWDIVYPGHKHLPIASISDGFAPSVITFVAPTKTFNIAGLHISNMIITEPDKQQIIQREIVRAGLSDNNLFGLLALEASYQYGEPWLNELLVYLQANVKLLTEFVGQYLPRVKLVQPEATYLAWLDVRDLGMDDAELQKRLAVEAKVAVHIGSTFGDEGKGFLRLNFACPRSVLEDALHRMRPILE